MTKTFYAALLAAAALAAAPAQAQHSHGHSHSHGASDASSNGRTALPQDALAPFVDPLTIPPRAEPVGEHEGKPLYEIIMKMVSQQVHRDLPPTPVFAYDGIWPGPTFDIPIGQPIAVNWVNALPEEYPDWLPVAIGHHVPDKVVRTVVHLHGGITPSEHDGFPEWMWEPGEAALYEYPNPDHQGDGAMLWYHDHAMGNTRLNVYAGLQGFYLLRNQALEEELGLPSGDYEVPLVLQDRNFAEDGSLVYDGVCRNFGTVNGTVFPYKEIEPRRYRFRILNGANFRIMQLALSNGAKMSAIGVDDGFLPETVETDELLLAPAERADVIIDFSDMAGEEITLLNTTSCFGPQREQDTRSGDTDLPHLMQFRVAESVSQPDTSSIPANPVNEEGEAERLLAQATVTRDITLDNPEGFTFLLENKGFDAPVSIEPHLGDTEIWNLINLTDEAHPIHVHLISYRIVERIPFRENGVEDYIADRDAGTLAPLESYLDMDGALPPSPVETGPKDVALAPFGYVTRIVMEWYGFEGLYVIHCHILDHEDDDMMRPIRVLAAREQ
jgi:spore coat protein A